MEIFEGIFTATPRPSNHEERIRARIAAWAQEMGITVVEDGTGNLLLRAAATAGCEAWPSILLQGHLDMVCEAVDPASHDFLEDPIRLRISDDGEWIQAEGTSLGADDGIGCSMALALLVDDDPSFMHGPVEILFTYAEEAGLDGANGMEAGALGIESRCLVNIDSEDFGVITIGSAGGTTVEFEATLETGQVPEAGMSFFKIMVGGLRGGHSGVDINQPRANAVKLVARLLRSALDAGEVHLCAWNGGTRHNAIPRVSAATVGVKLAVAEAFRNAINAEAGEIVTYYRKQGADGQMLEPEISISVEAGEETPCLDLEASARIVHFVSALPQGVKTISPAMPSLVETSNNVGILNVDAGNGIAHATIGIRSSVDAELEAFRRSIVSAGTLAGWTATLKDPYPPWEPDPGSPFLAYIKHCYEQVIDSPVQVSAVHAGLECSIIGKKIPALARAMVSIGPTVENPHSPAERVRIADIEKVYGALKIIIGGAGTEAFPLI
jgi:dipeptidase D